MRRIERLINLIAALLDTTRPLSADDIRRRIAGYDQTSPEAFRRAFERDKDALRTMGIPVEVRPVPGDDVDGYMIPKERYYLPDLDLEPDEVAALRLAAGAVLGSGALAESGVIKLSIDAPTVEWTGPRVVWGADVATEQPLLGTLYGSLLDKAPVSFAYRTADGSSSQRRVEPFGLVHRGGHWYLVGRDAGRDAIRSFKVPRIEGKIHRESGSYEIPEGFDATERLALEPWEIGEARIKVTLRFDPSVAWWAQQNLAAESVKSDPGGGAEVVLEVANLDALVSWVIGFGDEVEVLAPDAARAQVVDHLRPFLVQR